MADTKKAVLMFSSRRAVVFFAGIVRMLSRGIIDFAGNTLLRADAGLGDDAAPFLDVGTGALGDGVRRPGFGRHALCSQGLLALGGAEDVVHLAIEPRDDGRRRSRRCNERNP